MAGESDEVERVLPEAGIFCFPSLQEGFPNAVAEAMASGLAVVAFRDVNGVDDLVVPGETGLLAPQGNEEEFACCLRRLMADGELRKKMGAAGRKRVEKLCDPGRVLDAWEEVLTGTAAPSSRR